jgi:hypothetical protein
VWPATTKVGGVRLAATEEEPATMRGPTSRVPAVVGEAADERGSNGWGVDEIEGGEGSVVDGR